MTSEGQNVADLAGPEPGPPIESGANPDRESVVNPHSGSASSADAGGAAAGATGGPAAAAAPGGPAAGAAPSGPAGAKLSLGAARLWAVAASLGEWLARPRVRLTVTGVILLLVGGLLVRSSVWTLPLVIAGALMVVIAWIGLRLDGRLAVEWGETGTQVEFRAKIKAAQPARHALTEASSSSQPWARTAEPDDAEVVEGEAHTVEIEIAELRALIAAAGTEESDIVETDPSEQAKRNLRVAHRGGGSS